MKTNRLVILSLITAIALLLCACAKPEEGSSDTTVTQTNLSADSETELAETVDMNYIPELPENLYYGGQTISFLVEGQSFAADEFYAPNQNGEIVNDAVYERNMAVEDRLGVKLDFTVASASDVYDVGNRIEICVNSGDTSFNITTMPGYTHTRYVLAGCYYNLLNIENLNLDKYYWTQGFNEVMSNGEKQYVASGMYSLSMLRNMYITLYNKDIFEANNLEDLYDLVLNGQWTITKQSEMVRNIYNDVNGNGQKDQLDSYGFVSGTSTSTDPYWVAFGMRFLTPRDGIYMHEVNTEKLIDCVDKIQDLLFRNEGVFCVDSDSAYSTNIIRIFSENRAAMCTTMIYQIENFLTPSGFESDYGIAPMPKYDEAQENYYTHIQDQLSVMSIVATVPEDDLPMMGAVMELISAMSYKYVYNAYYNTALSYKYLQNQESVIMLDLVYRSIRIEATFIYSSKYAMLGKMRSVVSSGRNTMASAYKGFQKVWEAGTKELNEGLEKLNH
ncbi:MAG: hypothetical protein GX057_05165 [Clostridiales bacterium]|jgi:hypothetical protein|nr:hypothetical protein [Clostridiales bacterium]